MLQNKYNTSVQKKNKLSQNYSPLLFRITNDDDLFYFDRLIQSHSEIVILDEIESQLKDLMKLRHPTLKLDEDQLNKLVTEHLGGLSLEDYGTWVYYGWNNKMIHILDEKEFIEVKTSRNKNKITKSEQDLLATKKVGVIGLSVGQSVSATLAMERGFGEIRLADFDTLDLTNCNRIRTPIYNLGLSKTVITAREIAELDPYLKVTCFRDGVTNENIEDFIHTGGKLDLIIDECDSVDIKVLCRLKAKEHRIPVVMEMSDKGMIDIERFDLQPELKIFHGKIDHLDLNKLKDLDTQGKLSYLYPMVDGDNFSIRMKQSLGELGKTLTTWPQLASAVVLGGGACADVVRRILLNLIKKSGRFYVDIEQIIAD